MPVLQPCSKALKLGVGLFVLSLFVWQLLESRHEQAVTKLNKTSLEALLQHLKSEELVRRQLSPGGPHADRAGGRHQQPHHAAFHFVSSGLPGRGPQSCTISTQEAGCPAGGAAGSGDAAEGHASEGDPAAMAAVAGRTPDGGADVSGGGTEGLTEPPQCPVAAAVVAAAHHDDSPEAGAMAAAACGDTAAATSAGIAQAEQGEAAAEPAAPLPATLYRRVVGGAAWLTSRLPPLLPLTAGGRFDLWYSGQVQLLALMPRYYLLLSPALAASGVPLPLLDWARRHRLPHFTPLPPTAHQQPHQQQEPGPGLAPAAGGPGLGMSYSGSSNRAGSATHGDSEEVRQRELLLPQLPAGAGDALAECRLEESSSLWVLSASAANGGASVARVLQPHSPVCSGAQGGTMSGWMRGGFHVGGGVLAGAWLPATAAAPAATADAGAHDLGGPNGRADAERYWQQERDQARSADREHQQPPQPPPAVAGFVARGLAALRAVLSGLDGSTLYYCSSYLCDTTLYKPRKIASDGLICSYAECLLATRLLLRWRADVEDAAGVQLDTPTANIIWRRVCQEASGPRLFCWRRMLAWRGPLDGALAMYSRLSAVEVATRASKQFIQVASTARLLHDSVEPLTLTQMAAVLEPDNRELWRLLAADDGREAALPLTAAQHVLVPDGQGMAAGTGSGGGDVIAPRAFLCPITHDVMTQPCLLISPQLLSAPTYERSAIQTWLTLRQTDPRTNTTLITWILLPNDELFRCIDDWARGLEVVAVEATEAVAAPIDAAAEQCAQ
eukprot:XP_001695067.1 predicted protein [Chlamydomonas reinhardtii]